MDTKLKSMCLKEIAVFCELTKCQVLVILEIRVFKVNFISQKIIFRRLEITFFR